MAAPVVVFTDLDGTLLDHETYDHAPAAPLLARLKAAGLPVVLATSKTAAEVAGLREALGLGHCPAIVENGAGVLPPGRDRPEGERTHARLRAALEALPEALGARFVGFSDLSDKEVAQKTGLPLEDAVRARQRDFSEPGLFSGDEGERAEFIDRLSQAGIVAQQGGRYLTLSFGGSKVEAMKAIAAGYGARTVALGDAPNDRGMLEAADHAIIIPNPGHAGLPPLAGEATGRIRRARDPGPAGWAAALSALLQDLNILND